MAMVAPFEVVLKDSALQENWFRRLIAAIIDYIILGIVYVILSALVFAGWLITEGVTGRWSGAFRFGPIIGFGALGFIYWILSILYFAVLESAWGASIGKSLLGMRVIGEDGSKPLISNALIRNVSRIHGLIFLLDFIGGMVLEGDPRQRFTDRIAKTVVYQAKSGRGGPYVEAKILSPDEANAAAKGEGPEGVGTPQVPKEGETPKPPEEGEAPATAPKACPKCGAPVKEGDAFCGKCGAKLAA